MLNLCRYPQPTAVLRTLPIRGRAVIRWSSTVKHHEPLRILFCGADDFSIYSLRALHALRERSPQTVSSIEVVCRPDKRFGRGLKQIRAVPIKAAAVELELPTHQIDTFTGWKPPSTADLIVTVSFGLLVPARILTSATYGGLNVHPSLLPDLRGPAPVQHALLKRRQHAGVSLQTMHPTKFDHGVILSQSPKLHIPQDATPRSMIESLGPIAAELLVKGIENGLFLPQYKDKQSSSPGSGDLAHAPKIKPSDREIDWSSWTGSDIELRGRVLGRLWDTTTYAQSGSEAESAGSSPTLHQGKRITFTGPWKITDSSSAPGMKAFRQANAGRIARHMDSETKALRLGIFTADGMEAEPASATIEGEKKDAGLKTLLKRLHETANASGGDLFKY